MKKSSEDQVDQKEVQDANQTDQAQGGQAGFNHEAESVFDSIGITEESMDANIDKFCDAMNALPDNGKVSHGVETVESIFSPREISFLAFKGLEAAAERPSNPLQDFLSQLGK